MMIFEMYLLSNMDIWGIYVKFQGGNFSKPHGVCVPFSKQKLIGFLRGDGNSPNLP